jgi:hypothetical protein
MIKKIIFLALFGFGILSAGILDENRKGYGISYGLMGLEGSYFIHERNSEIMASVMSFSDDEYEDNYDSNKEESEFHISVHYRKFFKPQIGGWYYGGFLRYTNLEGKLKGEHSRATQSKVGVGAELGYTSFGLLDYSGLYWNVGFGIGPYLSGDNELFERDDMLGDASVAVHMDIIRLGYVF